MRKTTVITALIILLAIVGCQNPFSDPKIPDSIAAEQAPNVENATKSAVYFEANIDQYLEDPKLVKGFAKYNAVAWKGLNEVYNPSETGVPTE